MTEPSDLRFMVDQMLIKLGKYLRILGYDAEWDVAAPTDALIRRANVEDRLFLTRNRRLAAPRCPADHIIAIASSDPVEQPALLIGNRMVRNSASSFWTALLDEVRENCGPGATIELSALSGDRLARAELFPEQSLANHIERHLGGREQERLEDIIAELTLLGPPGPVAIRVLAGTDVLRAGALPLDAADTSVLTYLLAWLLEWGGLPEFTWNDKTLTGNVTALDPTNDRRYELEFTLANHHVSEGLYRRTLLLRDTYRR